MACTMGTVLWRVPWFHYYLGALAMEELLPACPKMTLKSQRKDCYVPKAGLNCQLIRFFVIRLKDLVTPDHVPKRVSPKGLSVLALMTPSILIFLHLRMKVLNLFCPFFQKPLKHPFVFLLLLFLVLLSFLHPFLQKRGLDGTRVERQVVQFLCQLIPGRRMRGCFPPC